METEFVQHEGLALVEMELRISSTSTMPILNQTTILQRASITEVCDGISSASFTIQSATRDYVDRILRNAQADKTPRIRWRLGIGFPAGATAWIPWQNHIIRHSGSALQGLGVSSGYTTLLTTSDLLWEIDRINRTVARKGKISDIVKAIADSYKLPAVIEPTKTEGLYYQCFISDYQFIRERMVPRAINDRNRGNYQFYLRDGTLHFHTVDYQAQLKNFVYYGSPGSNLTVQDVSQELIDQGSAGVRVVYYDPYTGKFGASVSKPENTLRLSNTVSDLTQLAGAERNIMLALGSNRDVDATSVAANTFEQAKLGVYALNLTIPKTLFFRANDLCRVTIQPDKAQVPPTSGTYQVFRIMHNVDKNAIVSEVSMRRGEFLTKDKTHTDLNQPSQQLINPAQSAKGQDPNFKAVADSTLTRGSGRQVSTTTVADTLDPNSD